MVGDLRSIRSSLATVVADLDPGSVHSSAVMGVFEELDQIERLAAAAKTLLACRLEDTIEFRRSASLSPAEFLAARSGTSIIAAKDVLATSVKVSELPVVEQALRDGRLSGAQAVTVVDAAAKDTGAQSRLVDTAKTATLRALKDEALRVKAAADPDREATEQRIHAARHVRTFTDAEGAWNLHARGPIAAGAAIEAALRPHLDAAFEQARLDSRREPLEAYTFDALTAAVAPPAQEGPAGRENLRYLGLLRLDLEALQRGHAVDGELCEITGLGPIPVATARRLLGESILKLVITKGVDVLHVTHLGRGPTVAQTIALLWQQNTCIVEGCDRTHREIDRREDWADTHHTRLDELELPCDEHHDLKTYQGWALVEGKGKRPMVPPDHPLHPNNKPPP